MKKNQNIQNNKGHSNYTFIFSFFQKNIFDSSYRPKFEKKQNLSPPRNLTEFFFDYFESWTNIGPSKLSRRFLITNPDLEIFTKNHFESPKNDSNTR